MSGAVEDPSGHSYGWLPDDFDPRDRRLRVTRSDVAALPRRADLRDTGKLPPVWDQQQLGSCTAHGVLGALLFAAKVAKRRDPMLSRLQLYYNSRVLEGTASEDSGAQVRDAIKAAAQGVGSESLWPYDISRFTEEPPAKVRRSAASNKAVTYERVALDQAAIMACLAGGWPFVDGMPVYESMESPEAASTGVVPMPQQGEQLLGYHCTLTVGYDLDAGVLIKRNSWGSGWGDAGYFTVPLAYRTFLSDAWRITLAT